MLRVGDAMYLIALTNVNEVKTSFANGQFLLIRREVYDAVGGHETVRDRFCEDVEIARVVKNAGYRPRLSWGVELAAVRMYSSLSSVMRGWSRNFFACSVGRPWRIIGALLFVVFSIASIVPATIWGVYRNVHPVSMIAGWGWLSAALCHAIGIALVISLSYHWTGNKRRWTLLFPLGATMLSAIYLRALWMCLTGRVEWRGTKYSHRMTPLVPSAREIEHLVGQAFLPVMDGHSCPSIQCDHADKNVRMRQTRMSAPPGKDRGTAWLKI